MKKKNEKNQIEKAINQETSRCSKSSYQNNLIYSNIGAGNTVDKKSLQEMATCKKLR